jgi:hypothetical protein
MIPRLGWWTALAALTPAMLVLSSCAGGNWSTLPNSPGVSQVASVGAISVEQPHIAVQNGQSNVTCPKRYLACVTVSQSTGAQIIFCYGPCTKSRAGDVTWSGIVCGAKGATCKKPIKQLTGTWTGPFKCRPKDQCKGTFELDTITPGPGLEQTKAYKYKQDSHICLGSKCADAYLGLNVGP